MELPPAVIVHGLEDARAALAPACPVTLLSAPGAALYAGCGWWSALVTAARTERPDGAAACPDILDCAAAAGRAMEALRAGQRLLVLRPCPAWQEVAKAARDAGAVLLDCPPPALDLARRGAPRRLGTWLASGARHDAGEPS